MNNLEQVQRDYLRGKEILDIVSNADNSSMEAIILRNVWTLEALGKMQNYILSLEDQGIELTIKKAD